MREETENTLLTIGMPAGIKGFTYICDAMDLYDADAYYENGKTCVLYEKIASRHKTTASSVERAIRHAFGAAVKRGDEEKVNQYLGTGNTKNSHLLHTLYIRMKQEQKGRLRTFSGDDGQQEMKNRIYQELMLWFSRELEQVINHMDMKN